MPYYPLSQIKTNLYTNGKEFILIINNQIYKGPYHKLSTGKFYTESIPNNNSLEITPINFEEVLLQGKPSNDVLDIPEIPNLKSISIANDQLTPSFSNTLYTPLSPILRSIPSSYYPVLSQEQKDNGQFIRYFTKKTNELKYIEIDKLTYNALKSKNSGIAFDLYEPTLITWRIKGDKTEIFNSNKRAVSTKEQQLKWPGFSKYFKDKFIQFYIEPNTQENLYTSGREFKTPDGKEYIGPYHVHPEKGPMVGATHIKRKHDLLTPIASSTPQIESTPQPLPTSTPTPPPSIGGGGYSGGGGY
tara:strand:- start:533 stop:1438 length:906 start_codon:yes stop_codon:yes gene_type:complete